MKMKELCKRWIMCDTNGTVNQKKIYGYVLANQL